MKIRPALTITVIVFAVVSAHGASAAGRAGEPETDRARQVRLRIGNFFVPSRLSKDKLWINNNAMRLNYVLDKAVAEPDEFMKSLKETREPANFVSPRPLLKSLRSVDYARFPETSYIPHFSKILYSNREIEDFISGKTDVLYGYDAF
jgi:hypothetical protein